jgi:hypothetical protein
MPGVPYLVHFPNGSTEVRSIRLPYVVSPGTALLPGWVVERVLPVEAVVEPNEDVAYEVWVVEDATEFVGHSADDVKHHQPLPPDALLDAALGPRPKRTGRP